MLLWQKKSKTNYCARDLTANEYIERLREDKWRKEEENKKTKEERERIRAEKNARKKERQTQFKEWGRGCGHGKGKDKLISSGHGSGISEKCSSFNKHRNVQ